MRKVFLLFNLPIIIVKLSRNPNPINGREFIMHTEKGKIYNYHWDEKSSRYSHLSKSFDLGGGVAATVKRQKRLKPLKCKWNFPPNDNLKNNLCCTIKCYYSTHAISTYWLL
jgi:hypothetical protein